MKEQIFKSAADFQAKYQTVQNKSQVGCHFVSSICGHGLPAYWCFGHCSDSDTTLEITSYT